MISLNVDFVILSTGLVPYIKKEKIVEILGLGKDSNGFLAEIHG